MCTDRLSFYISTFCLLSVFLGFVWICIQTEMISLYNINKLVYRTEISPYKAQWSLYVPPKYSSTFLRSAHRLYLWILCGCEKKERLFPYTTLTDLLYNRDFDIYTPVITICTAGMPFNISTFCPLIVFMCFVWILEQTANISIYNVNWLVYVTDISPFEAQRSLYVRPHYNSTFLRYAHSVYLWVMCGSENKCDYFLKQH